MSKGWDNAALKKLKALTGKGLSTAEIGKRLGMSKNAIVGKLNRLGWNPKASGSAAAPKVSAKKPTAKPEKKAPKTKQAPAKPPKKAAPAPKVVDAPKPKEKLPKSSTKNLAMHQRIIQHSLSMSGLKPNQCRWPIGDPDSEHFHFCGAPVFVGKPYCYEHCKQAYQFNPVKKK